MMLSEKRGFFVITFIERTCFVRSVRAQTKCPCRRFRMSCLENGMFSLPNPALKPPPDFAAADAAQGGRPYIAEFLCPPTRRPHQSRN